MDGFAAGEGKIGDFVVMITVAVGSLAKDGIHLLSEGVGGFLHLPFHQPGVEACAGLVGEEVG